MEAVHKLCAFCGTKQPSMKSVSTRVKLAFCLLGLLLCNPVSVQSLDFRKMFLNSHEHCGHTDAREPWQSVDKHAVYNILDDVSPDTGTHAFRECEMVFRSTRVDGRLCVLQRTVKFDSSDVKLELYDGHAGVDGLDKPNKTLNYDHGLLNLEWCTTGRILTINMDKSGPKASVRDLTIDLLVYDMQSLHRKAFMDTAPSCGSNFIMDHSRINVTNLDPIGGVRNAMTYPQCKLYFEYFGQEENRTMCVVFESSDLMCSGLNYTLTIHQYLTDPETGKTEPVFAGTRSCDKTEPMNWCSNSTKIHLELQRYGDVVLSENREAVVFYALVLDHIGDIKMLPSIFQPPQTASSENNIIIIIVIVVIGCLAFVVAIVVVAIIAKRKRSRSGDGGGKRSPGDGSPEQQRMMDIRSNGASGEANRLNGDGDLCNGRNGYSDGTTATASTPEFV